MICFIMKGRFIWIWILIRLHWSEKTISWKPKKHSMAFLVLSGKPILLLQIRMEDRYCLEPLKMKMAD